MDEKKKLNLDDDYIEFIRYGEYLIDKNGEGFWRLFQTTASLTDSLTVKMRKHLAKLLIKYTFSIFTAMPEKRNRTRWQQR
ncbi:MAG: hypothetical protein R2941_17055 [Desulfobacterales bacterium]